MMVFVRRLLPVGLILIAMSLVPSSGVAQSSTLTDFQQRCSAPGVVRCFGFDGPEDFNIGSGGSQGAWGHNFGILPPYGTTNYTRAVRDTSIAASGASSLRFVIPAGTGSDSSGAWFTNFSSDRSFSLGQGDEVYIQWRYRVDPPLLVASNWPSSDGFKVADAGTGDTASCSPSTATSTTCPTSCSDMEVVTQNVAKRGIPQVYANCGAPIGQPGLYGPNINFHPNSAFNCLYPGPYTAPNCVPFVANEWLTFKLYVKVGTWNSWSSTIKLWVAREGQPSRLIIHCGPGVPCLDNLGNTRTTGWYLNNSNTSLYRMGKVWLLPYQTSLAGGLAAANVWYDELIISRQDIADPGAGSPPDTLPPDTPSGLTIR